MFAEADLRMGDSIYFNYNYGLVKGKLSSYLSNLQWR